MISFVFLFCFCCPAFFPLNHSSRRPSSPNSPPRGGTSNRASFEPDTVSTVAVEPLNVCACPVTSATRLVWPRMTPASDTAPQAPRNPAPDAAAPCCRTPVNNTSKDELLTLHYPWHRLHGRQLPVVRLFSKHGVQICHRIEPGRVGLPSVELPLWMFDRVQCACMRSSSSPSANLQALVKGP